MVLTQLVPLANRWRPLTSSVVGAALRDSWKGVSQFPSFITSRTRRKPTGRLISCKTCRFPDEYQDFFNGLFPALCA